MLERTWKFENHTLFRAEKLYTAENYKSFIATFRKNFHQYIYYCYLRHKELISAPISRIDKVFVPKDRLRALIALEKPDHIQRMAINLVNLLSKESEVAINDFGIHGSIALNMHSEESDIDFVVLGSQNFRRVEATIDHLVQEGTLRYIFGNRLDAARKFKGKYKDKIWMFTATRKPEEVTTKYGVLRFSAMHPVKFECAVTDDSEAIFRPAIYKLSDYKPLNEASKLPTERIPANIVSNIGCYRNVARKGDRIRVSGVLERIESNKTGEVSYQVVVGTATAEDESICPL